MEIQRCTGCMYSTHSSSSTTCCPKSSFCVLPGWPPPFLPAPAPLLLLLLPGPAPLPPAPLAGPPLLAKLPAKLLIAANACWARPDRKPRGCSLGGGGGGGGEVGGGGGPPPFPPLEGAAEGFGLLSEGLPASAQGFRHQDAAP